MNEDVLVVAGEASGDRHAADVVAALKTLRPELRFFGMGGPALQAQGVELVHGSHEISVMGITEVVPKIPRILQVLGDIVKAVDEKKPRVALLVDVPDFNFRLAKKLKARGIKVAWYISPMVWAWRQGRVKTIQRLVDRMMCILPFEEPFLRERGVDAKYVGNPVVEQVPAPATTAEFRSRLGLAHDGPLLAVLPGSRRSEIRRILPTLVDTCVLLTKEQPGLKIAVPIAPGLPRELVEAPFAAKGLTPFFIDGRAPEVVGASDVAVVASGTATLEAGLMQRPLVVVYRLTFISYLVGRALVKLPHFSLVNLLAGRKVVPELLQAQFTAEATAAEVRALWQGPARDAQLEGLEGVRRALGEPGAARRAAHEVQLVLMSAVPPQLNAG